MGLQVNPTLCIPLCLQEESKGSRLEQVVLPLSWLHAPDHHKDTGGKRGFKSVGPFWWADPVKGDSCSRYLEARSNSWDDF